jgi:hypothetical protein
MYLLGQNEAVFGRDSFYPIYSCCLLALVILSYSTHCEQSGRFGLHHQFLEMLDCPFVATLTSSIDSLLDAVDMLL